MPRVLVLCLCFIVLALPDGPLSSGASSRGSGPVWVQRAGPVAIAKSSSRIARESVRRADPTPSRLVIPRISVDASVEALGLDQKRNLASPSDYRDVAWYNLGPAPGEPGNALMNGHVNWWTGSAVFTRLADLVPGDEVIVVRTDGTRLTFKVTNRTTVAAGARVAALFAPSPTATLTLITCTGEWDARIQSDTRRLLVSATLE